MSAPKPSNSSDATLPAQQQAKPTRVLACVLCQHRKVKCDRRFPCTNCTKSKVECVPATQVFRQRKRRFPERELLDRLRKYEDLLRQNHIPFEPLHSTSTPAKESPNVETGYDSGDEHGGQGRHRDGSESTPGTSVKENETRVWHNMNRDALDSDNNSDASDDEVRGVVLRSIYDMMFKDDDHLLFGSRTTAVDIKSLHPDPVQIFRLWQIYLDNVNPLLKVTHTPTLQGRIIAAVGSKIEPNLEALMFSIYCMAVTSVAPEECQTMFGLPKKALLTRYQFGCQQALLNCSFLRCESRDCLTALFLYLVSVRTSTIPQALSSMLGVAIRIAQRMGIHSESSLTKHPLLEAEMRRRLWWALILYDARIGEMSDFKAGMPIPSSNCAVPLNLSDSDLRPEMKEPPQVESRATEAIFAVVRSELLNATTCKGAKTQLTEGDMAILEKTITEKYLSHLDPSNALHFLTIHTTNSTLAKTSLLGLSPRSSPSTLPHAIQILRHSTQITLCPLMKPFLWLVHQYFPLIAYIQIVRHLKANPQSAQAEAAWEVMSTHYDACFGGLPAQDNPFFKLFTRVVLQAWEAKEEYCRPQPQLQSQLPGQDIIPPRIVLAIRQNAEELARRSAEAQGVHLHPALGDGAPINNNNPSTFSLPLHSSSSSSMPPPGGFRDQIQFGGVLHGAGTYNADSDMGMGVYGDMPGFVNFVDEEGGDGNQLDVDWGEMGMGINMSMNMNMNWNVPPVDYSMRY